MRVLVVVCRSPLFGQEPGLDEISDLFNVEHLVVERASSDSTHAFCQAS